VALNHTFRQVAVQVAVLALVVAGCAAPVAPPTTAPAAKPTPAPSPVVGAARSPRQAVIVEPRAAPGVFPRTLRDVNGDLVLTAPPRRIHTLSVGFDEITFRLVDPDRIVAVGTVTANRDFSNVADQAAGVPNKVGRDAEQIVALMPDLVVASPFANADLMRQLRAAGVPLFVADLVSSASAQADNIRLLAYLYGAEERGEALVSEVESSIARVRAVADRHRAEPPSAIILSGGQTVSAAGSGTTEAGVLELVGVRNAAADAGVVGNKDVSLEALPDMRPDFVVVAEVNPERPTLVPRLREHPVVGALPALQTKGRLVVIRSSLLTTLSHWNVVGAEQLSRAFFPGDG
jgi:iron complex transport system substrate-binding protein